MVSLVRQDSCDLVNRFGGVEEQVVECDDADESPRGRIDDREAPAASSSELVGSVEHRLVRRNGHRIV